jgi:hypothetical protein
MSADNTARKGKIARLPQALREQLNERLRDGQSGPEIIAWLNAEPIAVEIMQKHFSGDLVNEQNLSAWRNGGYLEWCADEARADLLQARAEMAVKLVQKSGLCLSDAAAAIAAGDLLADIEAEVDPEMRDKLIKQIATLRAGDHSVHDGRRKERKLELDTAKHELKLREVILQEEKFKRLLIEKLIETAAKPEIQAILSNGKAKSIQMEELHLKLFGEAPTK